MATSLLNFGASQRLDLSDLLQLSQGQPLGLSADLAGTFLSRAATNASKYVLHGFRVVSGVSSGNANPAQNQLQVSPGAAILAYRQGAGTPLFGVLAALDGTDQSAQFVDLTYQPASQYTVFLRLNYADSSPTDRSFWSAATPGKEYASLTPTRKIATWEVQALATGSNPGSEWLAIANLTWTAPTTQGGIGTISGLTDTRPLYFEGDPSATTPYSVLWGTGTNDRSADRASYGVGDLKTFVDAIKVCLEDIKGPGVARWYSPGVAGMNMGFTPNTPQQSRLAVGDASLYLQGRTSSTNGHAYLTVQQDSNGNRTGWDFGSDRTRYMLLGNPFVTYGGYGTVGFGLLSEIDIMSNPGRSLVEMVVTTSNQSALRLGARANNSAVPVGLDVNLNIAAPDQSGNMARVLFSKGGVQGVEAALYWIGKGSDNGFVINDIAGNNNFFSFSAASKTLGFAAGPMVFNDIVNNVQAFSYSTSTRIFSFAGQVSASVLNAPSVTSNNFSGPAGNISSLTASTLQVQSSANSPTYNISTTLFATSGNLQVPASSSPPSNPQPGAMFYRIAPGTLPNYARIYIYIPLYAQNKDGTTPGQAGAGDDGLPGGWKAVAV